MRLLLVPLVPFVLSACAPTTESPDASTPDAGSCHTWESTELASRLHVPDLLEASGLAASWRHPGVFWTHDDSGGEPRVYAAREDGTHAGTWSITGATNTDWEDLGVGPCWPGQSASCLYIGDVGDNAGAKSSVSLHVVEEPETLEVRTGATLPLVRSRTFTYDSGAHDVESLLVDPATADVYLVGKRPYDNDAPRRRRIHRLRTTTEEANPVATLVTTLLVPGDDDGLLTGGAIRPDGLAMLLRTYANGYEYRRTAEQPFTALFDATPTTIPPVRLGEGETEIQGEAITYAHDGRAIYTTSEGETPPLNVRRCRD